MESVQVLEDDRSVPLLSTPPDFDVTPSPMRMKLRRKNGKKMKKKDENFIGQETTESTNNKIDDYFKQSKTNRSCKRTLELRQKLNLKIGDFVTVKGSPKFIGQVWAIGRKFLHLNRFVQGSDSKLVMQFVAGKNEIFQLESCQDVPIEKIGEKIRVNFVKSTEENVFGPKCEEHFWYRMMYQPKSGRFSHSNGQVQCFCPKNSSETLSKLEKVKSGDFVEFVCDSVVIKGLPLRVHHAIYIYPDQQMNDEKDHPEKPEKMTKDASRYPEYHRKAGGNLRGLESKVPKPFEIGIVEEILTKGKSKLEFTLKVRKMFRPEELSRKIVSRPETKDLELLIYSDEMKVISPGQVYDKCFVRFFSPEEEPENIRSWLDEGENRFYFQDFFCPKTSKLSRCETESTTKKYHPDENPTKKPKLETKLKCFDFFSGLGGLSHGLEMSGLSQTCWAMEFDASAAKALKMNHPNAKIFRSDCHILLEKIKDGEAPEGFPKEGEVDVVVGGPPCQGYSMLNRFSSSKSSQKKNNLVPVFFQYCKLLKPKFIVMENVENFLKFDKSQILKDCVQTLLSMGYANQFGILQAGNFGVAQHRRRFFLLASAPGFDLPRFPSNRHVFKFDQVKMKIDDLEFEPVVPEPEAIFRKVTIFDAIGDLPVLKDGVINPAYPEKKLGPIHKCMRKNTYSKTIKHHVTSKTTVLNQNRFKYIPRCAGADWRDLPNIEIESYQKLSDGTKLIKKLDYGKDGKVFCQVCDMKKQIETKENCSDNNEQTNTMIPWCLAHGADNNHDFAGCFGRLDYAGHSDTLTTRIDPMLKQGRILHPVQHRIISVRECFRIQGFPDEFEAYGSKHEMYKQVGNAVPGPLGQAVGNEILRVLIPF